MFSCIDRWALHFALEGKGQDTLIFVMCFLAIIPLASFAFFSFVQKMCVVAEPHLAHVLVIGRVAGLYYRKRDHVDISDDRRSLERYPGEHGRGRSCAKRETNRGCAELIRRFWSDCNSLSVSSRVLIKISFDAAHLHPIHSPSLHHRPDQVRVAGRAK